MMRIALFLLTNLAVMVVFGLVLSLTGIQSSSMTGLLIMALLFGFGGSIVSLMMSKWMALKSVGGEVIEQPRNETERWLMNTVAQQAQQVGIAMPQVAIYLFKSLSCNEKFVYLLQIVDISYAYQQPPLL